jgi:hypothetical protein
MVSLIRSWLTLIVYLIKETLMKLLLKLFKGPLKAILLREMRAQQATVVQIVNDNLDIPKLEEVEEAKLLFSIYDAVEEALVKVIDRI